LGTFRRHAVVAIQTGKPEQFLQARKELQRALVQGQAQSDGQARLLQAENEAAASTRPPPAAELVTGSVSLARRSGSQDPFAGLSRMTRLRELLSVADVAEAESGTRCEQ
jgi:hypothetical protein